MSMNQFRTYAAFNRGCLLALLVLLSSCRVLPPTVAERAGTERSAENAARKGDHAQAANIYERIANARPPSERVDLELTAAREWLAANRPAEAMRVLGTITG